MKHLIRPSAGQKSGLDEYRGMKAPYFHHSWVHIPWDLVPDEEFQERIVTSYELIRAKLPKKVQSTLQNPD